MSCTQSLQSLLAQLAHWSFHVLLTWVRRGKPLNLTPSSHPMIRPIYGSPVARRRGLVVVSSTFLQLHPFFFLSGPLGSSSERFGPQLGACMH